MATKKTPPESASAAPVDRRALDSEWRAQVTGHIADLRTGHAALKNIMICSIK